MQDEELLDALCKARLERRGYTVRKQSDAGLGAVDLIKRRVAEYYAIPLVALNGRGRAAAVVWARQVAMYIARAKTKLSAPEIGREFDRDHATILWACKTVELRRHQEPKINLELLDIGNGLR